MFRFLLFILVGLALFVFMRLVLLRLKMMEGQSHPRDDSGPRNQAQSEYEGQSKTIDPPRPLELKSYRFANFDYRIGPKNREDFCENFLVDVAQAGANSHAVRKYSLYVATPKGIDAAMRSNHQDYKFGRNLLIVERYDVELILRAVRQHVNELGLLGEDVS